MTTLGLIFSRRHNGPDDIRPDVGVIVVVVVVVAVVVVVVVVAAYWQMPASIGGSVRYIILYSALKWLVT